MQMGGQVHAITHLELRSVIDNYNVSKEKAYGQEISVFEELREQLIASYKPRSMPGTSCALCAAKGPLISMHLMKFYHDASTPTPPAFVPMSESGGTRRGSVPVCVDCAPACSRCGLPVSTSWIKKMCAMLQASTLGITFSLGNGHCRHVHPVLNMRSWTKPVRLPKVGSFVEESWRRGSDSTGKAHLPGHLVPPPGHHPKTTITTADIHTAIEAASDPADKATILITRSFENALYCDAREWDPASAKELVRRLFTGPVEQQTLEELQLIAEEAVLLGYRAATPLDFEVIMGQKPNNSWRPELDALIVRARSCVARDH